MKLRTIAILTLVAFLGLSFAGCLGNSVSIAGQGGAFGKKTKSLDCGATGQVSVGEQGGGTFIVRVFDGDDNLVYQSGGFSGGQSAAGGPVNGVPGTWTLQVDFGAGYGGQYGVTLSC